MHSKVLSRGALCLFALAVACNSVIGADPGKPTGAGGAGGGAPGSGGSGGTMAPDAGPCSDQPETPAPIPLSPDPSTPIPGPSLSLAWSGGEPPYEVELAFDAAFTDPVPGLSPLSTDQATVEVAGLNGGKLYWRVRSLGGCGPSAFSEPARLHVTCNPVQLTATADESEIAGAIAWNPIDKEYGVTLTKGSPSKIYFARVDRLGDLLSAPIEITGPSLPYPDVGYQSHSLAYVASTDRWVVTYHREGADQAYATLFDDAGTALATYELDDGGDSERQSVSYHPDADMIVTSNDVGGSPWTTRVHRFDGALTFLSPSTDAAMGPSSTYDGAFGSSLALPGLAGSAHYAAVAFQYRHAVSPALYHLMLQLIRLDDGTILWPPGTQYSTIAGRQLVAGVTGPEPMLEWNPTDRVLAVAYGRDNGVAWGMDNDVFLMLVDPLTASVLVPTIHLNAAAPSTSARMFVKVAWDGEELLALWIDGRAGANHYDLRLTKLSSAGTVLGAGDYRYDHPGDVNSLDGGPARAVVGHDGIHAMVYHHLDAGQTNRDVWLCIEPAYD